AGTGSSVIRTVYFRTRLHHSGRLALIAVIPETLQFMIPPDVMPGRLELLYENFLMRILGQDQNIREGAHLPAQLPDRDAGQMVFIGKEIDFVDDDVVDYDLIGNPMLLIKFQHPCLDSYSP